MFNKRFLTIFLALNLVTATNLFAQPQNNSFINGAKGVISSFSTNPFNTDPNNRRLEAGAEGFELRSDSCKGENCDQAVAMQKIKPNKGYSVNVMAPMAGMSDTMHSQVYTDQLGTILSSPMVLYNTTMALTEPAVAAGIQNSVMQGYGAINARYLSEQSLIKEMESQPATKEVQLRAYAECKGAKIRSRGKGGQADATADETGWIEAQSLCMADRNVSVADFSGQAENFEKLDDPMRGFDFSDDQSHQSALDGKTNDVQINSKQYLTDYIFNNIDPQSMDGYSIDDVEALKISFQELLGDYEFRMQDDIDNQGARPRSSSRQLEYTYVPPTIKKSELVNDLERTTYNNIMLLVHQKCMFDPVNNVAESKNTLTLNQESFCNPHRQATTGTLAPETMGRIFGEISLMGYQFDCAMLDMIYSQFEHDYAQIAGIGGDTEYKDIAKRCEVLDPSGKTSSYDQAKDQSATSASTHTKVLFLANRIADGKVYLAIKFASTIIDRMVETRDGASFLPQLAYGLIENVIGHGDLNGRYRAILVEIQDKFRVDFQQSQTKRIGNAASKMNAIQSIKYREGTKAIGGK